MAIYLVLIGLLILVPSKLQLRGINSTYLTKESCNAVKGIFILLIFASHFANAYGKGYTSLLDTSYWKIRVALGQCVVANFLFYSGYGVMLSAAKKGKSYIGEFPRKRILRTLLIYDCSQVLFLIFQLWQGNHYNIKSFVTSFLAWESFGNDNWYIFVIICLYIISWIVLQNGSANKSSAMKATVGAIALITFLICAQKGTYWYNTVLCYVLGMWYFLYQEKLEAILQKDRHYVVVAGAVALLYVVSHKFWTCNLFMYELTACSFAVLVVFITMKFQIKNQFLIYCGEHVQGLFLLHRLPMRFLSGFSFFKNNLYIFFSMSIVMTFALEFVFTRLLRCMQEEDQKNICE